MHTVITKPIVGPMTLQWQGFWSLERISSCLKHKGTDIRTFRIGSKRWEVAQSRTSW